MVAGARSGWAARVSVEKADGFDPATIKRAAFLPLTRIMPVAEGVRPVCPLTKTGFDGCKIEDDAEAVLSRALGGALIESGASVSWVAQAEINAAQAKLKKDDPTLSPAGPRQLAIGRELKADAVLTGFIYCFRERLGGAFASSRPAALGFCLHLMEPATGKILWSLRYEDEQAPLSDNLMAMPEFLKRKGKWITVGQMAEEAAGQVALALPWNKKSDEGKDR